MDHKAASDKEIASVAFGLPLRRARHDATNGRVARELPVASALLVRLEFAQVETFVIFPRVVVAAVRSKASGMASNLLARSTRAPERLRHERGEGERSYAEHNVAGHTGPD